MPTTGDSTNAFDGYGIPDAIDLGHRTRYRLSATGKAEFEPTPEFLTSVVRAFRAAYIAAAEVPLVPEPLDASFADAVALTAEPYRDAPDADLRGEVLPSFYARLVGLFCTYLESPPDDGIGIWLATNDPRRGPRCPQPRRPNC